MSILNEYLVHTYMAERHRETQRLPRRHRNSSSQVIGQTKFALSHTR